MKKIIIPLKWLISKVEWILNSFNTNSDPSSRKLQALGFFILIAFIHNQVLSKDNAISFLLIDCITLLLLYGIIHASDINNFFDKNEKSSKQDIGNNNTN